MSATAKQVLDVMRGWIGYSERNGKYMTILNTYNSHKPLARGYAIKPTDEWCDCTVSTAAIVAGAVDIIGTEVSCEQHIQIFKKKGIWIEDGTIVPKPGYICLYNWDDSVQPNDGTADHIGYVEQVQNGVITVIEGNKGEIVGRRCIKIGYGCIRGFAAPKYDEEDDDMDPATFSKMFDAKIESLKKESIDEERDSWSKEARDWAEAEGLIAGDKNGNKQWKAFLTREQFAVILHRFFKLLKK